MNGEWLNRYKSKVCDSLRASSPIWASEASLARTRERAAKPRGAEERTPRSRVLARLTQIGELARRLGLRIQPIHLAAWLAPRNVRSGGPDDYLRTSLQCRRILGGQNLVRARIILAAIFDFMTVEHWGE